MEIEHPKFCDKNLSRGVGGDWGFMSTGFFSCPFNFFVIICKSKCWVQLLMIGGFMEKCKIIYRQNSSMWKCSDQFMVLNLAVTTKIQSVGSGWGQGDWLFLVFLKVTKVTMNIWCGSNLPDSRPWVVTQFVHSFGKKGFVSYVCNQWQSFLIFKFM